MAFGVVERHGDHLPLGTDYLNSHKIVCMAAEKEPAVVFPPYYFGQIYEARCFPGTITIRPALLIDLIQSLFDEIARNGFRKIIMYCGHGGNRNLMQFLAQATLWEEKPYSVYMPATRLTPERQKQWQAIMETPGGHAGESETSISMANHGELVKLDQLTDQRWEAMNRLNHLPGNYSGIWWYADHPEHYAGDAKPSSAEKGRKLRQLIVDSLAEYIAAVKADETVPALEREFFKRVDLIGEATGQVDNPF
jgi:creatinine amidohydrolase